MSIRSLNRHLAQLTFSVVAIWPGSYKKPHFRPIQVSELIFRFTRLDY
ncbi:hypothetical protein LINPERPRIM_LOCUS39786 [Linum perenne]